MSTKAMLVASEAMASAMHSLPATVIIGVVLDDGAGFIMHTTSPPEDKRNLDWLLRELKQTQADGWPGEPFRVER